MATTLSTIRRVAVVGAGAGGLVAARALREEGCFTAIDVFEQRGNVGGVWNYTPQTKPTDIPSVDPNVVENSDEKGTYISAVYDNLGTSHHIRHFWHMHLSNRSYVETNIPKTLMSFPEHPFSSTVPLFPHHTQVLSYLCTYSSDLHSCIQFGTQVLSIVPSDPSPGWALTTSCNPSPIHYDAVMIATGHYNTPYIPPLPGLSTFPGTIVHSRNFRLPQEFAEKKVLLVGNSASAVDIAMQLLPYVKGPLLQAIRSPTGSAMPPPEGIKAVPEISAVHSDGSMSFVDGTVVTNVDAILFATGYLFTLPFLPKELGLVAPHGERVMGTFQHVFYQRDPTLCFLGLPTKVVPFPLAQSQAAWVARVFAGRLTLPAREEMEIWEKGEVEKKGNGRPFHYFGFPWDVEYMDAVEAMVDRAKGEGGLEPARWRGWERWVRERVPKIKKAFEETGKKALTMEELGFMFEDRGVL